MIFCSNLIFGYYSCLWLCIGGWLCIDCVLIVDWLIVDVCLLMIDILEL